MTEDRKIPESKETAKADKPSDTSSIGEFEPGEVVEEELVEGAPVRRKGIYLLPNALTTAVFRFLRDCVRC